MIFALMGGIGTGQRQQCRPVFKPKNGIFNRRSRSTNCHKINLKLISGLKLPSEGQEL